MTWKSGWRIKRNSFSAQIIFSVLIQNVVECLVQTNNLAKQEKEEKLHSPKNMLMRSMCLTGNIIRYLHQGWKLRDRLEHDMMLIIRGKETFTMDNILSDLLENGKCWTKGVEILGVCKSMVSQTDKSNASNRYTNLGNNPSVWSNSEMSAGTTPLIGAAVRWSTQPNYESGNGQQHWSGTWWYIETQERDPQTVLPVKSQGLEEFTDSNWHSRLIKHILLQFIYLLTRCT